MKKISNRRSDILFTVAAVALFGVFLGYAVYSVSFVAMHLNAALRPPESEGQLIEYFDFDKLSQLLEAAPLGQTP